MEDSQRLWFFHDRLIAQSRLLGCAGLAARACWIATLVACIACHWLLGLSATVGVLLVGVLALFVIAMMRRELGMSLLRTLADYERAWALYARYCKAPASSPLPPPPFLY